MERNYKKLAKLFKEFHGESTKETEIEIKVSENGIDLFPAKWRTNTNAFHLMEEVVDFCRVYKLSHYVAVQDGVAVCIMF